LAYNVPKKLILFLNKTCGSGKRVVNEDFLSYGKS
jgi:hypothetical protein